MDELRIIVLKIMVLMLMLLMLVLKIMFLMLLLLLLLLFTLEKVAKYIIATKTSTSVVTQGVEFCVKHLI